MPLIPLPEVNGSVLLSFHPLVLMYRREYPLATASTGRIPPKKRPIRDLQVTLDGRASEEGWEVASHNYHKKIPSIESIPLIESNQ